MPITRTVNHSSHHITIIREGILGYFFPIPQFSEALNTDYFTIIKPKNLWSSVEKSYHSLWDVVIENNKTEKTNNSLTENTDSNNVEILKNYFPDIQPPLKNDVGILFKNLLKEMRVNLVLQLGDYILPVIGSIVGVNNIYQLVHFIYESVEKKEINKDEALKCLASIILPRFLPIFSIDLSVPTTLGALIGSFAIMPDIKSEELHHPLTKKLETLLHALIINVKGEFPSANSTDLISCKKHIDQGEKARRRCLKQYVLKNEEHLSRNNKLPYAGNVCNDLENKNNFQKYISTNTLFKYQKSGDPEEKTHFLAEQNARKVLVASTCSLAVFLIGAPVTTIFTALATVSSLSGLAYYFLSGKNEDVINNKEQPVIKNITTPNTAELENGNSSDKVSNTEYPDLSNIVTVDNLLLKNKRATNENNTQRFPFMYNNLSNESKIIYERMKVYFHSIYPNEIPWIDCFSKEVLTDNSDPLATIIKSVWFGYDEKKDGKLDKIEQIDLVRHFFFELVVGRNFISSLLNFHTVRDEKLKIIEKLEEDCKLQYPQLDRKNFKQILFIYECLQQKNLHIPLNIYKFLKENKYFENFLFFLDNPNRKEIILESVIFPITFKSKGEKALYDLARVWNFFVKEEFPLFYLNKSVLNLNISFVCEEFMKFQVVSSYIKQKQINSGGDYKQMLASLTHDSIDIIYNDVLAKLKKTKYSREFLSYFSTPALFFAKMYFPEKLNNENGTDIENLVRKMIEKSELLQEIISAGKKLISAVKELPFRKDLDVHFLKYNSFFVEEAFKKFSIQHPDEYKFFTSENATISSIKKIIFNCKHFKLGMSRTPVQIIYLMKGKILFTVMLDDEIRFFMLKKINETYSLNRFKKPVTSIPNDMTSNLEITGVNHYENVQIIKKSQSQFIKDEFIKFLNSQCYEDFLTKLNNNDYAFLLKLVGEVLFPLISYIIHDEADFSESNVMKLFPSLFKEIAQD